MRAMFFLFFILLFGANAFAQKPEFIDPEDENLSVQELKEKYYNVYGGEKDPVLYKNAEKLKQMQKETLEKNQEENQNEPQDPYAFQEKLESRNSSLTGKSPSFVKKDYNPKMESYDYQRYDMDENEYHFIDDRHLKNAIAKDVSDSDVQENPSEEEFADDDIYAKIRSLKILANMGDISAIYNLGLIYYEGQGGITQDFIEAFSWFEKGAEKKDKDCSYMLGFMFENAQGTEINVQKAIELYEIAAEQELIDAKKRLAAIYSLDDYKNDAKARKYYEDIVALDGNDFNSKYNLAIMYYSGAGGGVNYQKAVDLFKEAAENKDDFFYANYLIASIYRSGVLGKPDNLEALNWYKKAAELGVADAFFDMASVYYEGKFGAPKNLSEAYKWFYAASLNTKKDTKPFLEDIEDTLPKKEIKKIITETEDFLKKYPIKNIK